MPSFCLECGDVKRDKQFEQPRRPVHVRVHPSQHQDLQRAIRRNSRRHRGTAASAEVHPRLGGNRTIVYRLLKEMGEDLRGITEDMVDVDHATSMEFRPYTVAVPIREMGDHDYPIGKPCLFNTKGSRGHYAWDKEGKRYRGNNLPYDLSCFRPATDEEVEVVIARMEEEGL